MGRFNFSRAVKSAFRMPRASKMKSDISRGLKKAGSFIGDQMKHPAVQQLATDSLGILASSGGNPQMAGAMLGQRLAQEGAAVANRSINHYAP
jgi:hypothetical protein